MLRCGGLVYCLVGAWLEVFFGLCGGGAVFHDVEFLCAEWWLAYLRSRSWSLNMRLCLLVGFGWCCAVSYLDGLSVLCTVCV